MTEPVTHHVGITVADLDRMVAFYTDVFDFDVAAEFTAEGEGFATAVDVDGASADFVHLDAGGCRLELVAYEPQGTATDEQDIHQPGAAHPAFEVDDVDALYESLPDEITTLSPPQTTSTGTRICFLRDPEGNLVEFLNPNPE